MQEPPKPVRARPVALPPDATPTPPAPQQTTPQPRQATLNDLAYELREIRLLMRRTAAAKRRGAMLFLTFGGVSLGLGLLLSLAEFNRAEQETAFAIMKGLAPPSEPERWVPPGVLVWVGAVLMLVGGSMQYDPDREK